MKIKPGPHNVLYHQMCNRPERHLFQYYVRIPQSCLTRTGIKFFDSPIASNCKLVKQAYAPISNSRADAGVKKKERKHEIMPSPFCTLPSNLQQTSRTFISVSCQKPSIMFNSDQDFILFFSLPRHSSNCKQVKQASVPTSNSRAEAE